jgi:hypothetical protein
VLFHVLRTCRGFLGQLRLCCRCWSRSGHSLTRQSGRRRTCMINRAGKVASKATSLLQLHDMDIPARERQRNCIVLVDWTEQDGIYSIDNISKHKYSRACTSHRKGKVLQGMIPCTSILYVRCMTRAMKCPCFGDLYKDCYRDHLLSMRGLIASSSYLQIVTPAVAARDSGFAACQLPPPSQLVPFRLWPKIVPPPVQHFCFARIPALCWHLHLQRSYQTLLTTVTCALTSFHCWNTGFTLSAEEPLSMRLGHS